MVVRNRTLEADDEMRFWHAPSVSCRVHVRQGDNRVPF